MTTEFTKEQLLAGVSPVVMSATEDADLLRQCPHTIVKGTDLALVARMQDTEGKNVLVTNEIKSQAHLTEAEIMRAATQNMISGRDGGYVIAPLNQMIGLPEDPDAPKLLVVTNQSGQYGAAEALNPRVQQELSQQLAGDFYILPSSKPEVIAVSASAGLGQRELQGMVADINASEVSKADKLSDTVYRYDFQSKTFGVASEMEKTQVMPQVETAGRGRRM